MLHNKTLQVTLSETVQAVAVLILPQIRATWFIHTPHALHSTITLITATITIIITTINIIITTITIITITLIIINIKVFQSGSNGSGFPFDPQPLLIVAALTFNFHHIYFTFFIISNLYLIVYFFMSLCYH